MTSTDCRDAIERGRTDFVAVLLDQKEPAETVLAEALRWSSYYGDVTACRLLLSAGVPLTRLGPDLGILGAAFHGHWQLTQFLLEQGASACYRDPTTGETPLHGALTNEDRERYDLVVQVLLAAGADPNVVSSSDVPTSAFMRDARTRGETPLHRAALFGTTSTLTLLFAAGARIDAQDARGETPLAWASWARRPAEILRLLLYGDHAIHPQYRPLRRNLRGDPVGERSK
jgi:ankyrin repeat protein